MRGKTGKIEASSLKIHNFKDWNSYWLKKIKMMLLASSVAWPLNPKSLKKSMWLGCSLVIYHIFRGELEGDELKELGIEWENLPI